MMTKRYLYSLIYLLMAVLAGAETITLESSDGRKLEAEVFGVTDSAVEVIREDGARFTIKKSQLTAASWDLVLEKKQFIELKASLSLEVDIDTKWEDDALEKFEYFEVSLQNKSNADLSGTVLKYQLYGTTRDREKQVVLGIVNRPSLAAGATLLFDTKEHGFIDTDIREVSGITLRLYLDNHVIWEHGEPALYMRAKPWLHHTTATWIEAGKNVFADTSRSDVEPVGNTFETYHLNRTPQLISGLVPKYPNKFRESGIGGNVTLRIKIDESGKVIQAIAQESSDPEFTESALKAIRDARFDIPTRNGNPVKTVINLPITFQAN